MALFRGIPEYIALDANNIVNISGNIFLFSPQGHPISYISLWYFQNPVNHFQMINSNEIDIKIAIIDNHDT